MNIQEACHLLGVTGTATPAEVKAAYRKVSRTAHPDRGGSADLMSDVNLARDILTGKAPSSTDIFAPVYKAEPEPLSKQVEVSLSYEEWRSGTSKSFVDTDINRILGKIINFKFELEIPPYQNLDEPIRFERGESCLEFEIKLDTGLFSRRGYDLLAQKHLPLYKYLYDRHFYIQHPLSRERVKVEIPENQSFIGNKKNAVVLKGKGICSDLIEGDVIIVVKVVLPDFENLSDKAKSLLKPGLAQTLLKDH